MTRLVNNELERIWKETAVAQQRYCPGICLEVLRKPGKISVKIECALAEIRNKYLQNISPKDCRYTSLLDVYCDCNYTSIPHPSSWCDA
jgi:hypothetical protein